MKLSIEPAKEKEQAILENLLQCYIHDFSEFSPQKMDSGGRYHYPYLKHYWTDPDRHAYLFRQDTELVGFALLRTEIDPLDGSSLMDLAEFFILKSHRKFGLGRDAAQLLWQRYPLRWQLKVLEKNRVAKLFWASVIDEYTGGKFEFFDRETGPGKHDSPQETIYTFVSSP